MDKVRKKAPIPSAFPKRTTASRDDYVTYVTPHNINSRQKKELIRFDTYDPEVYLTPQHLIDQMTTDLNTVGKGKNTEPEDENMRKNVFGNLVQKRPAERTYVQDMEDEDGYSLATTSAIHAPQITTLSNRTKSDKPNLSNGSTCFEGQKTHRCIIGCLVALFVVVVTGAAIYFLKEGIAGAAPYFQPGNV